MGLDIARTLGSRGIPVFGIDSDKSTPGKYSKYIEFFQCPEPEINDGASYVQFLVDFGKKLGGKAVLFPLSDKHVLICSREREILSQYYDYVMTDHETVINLTTKNGLATLARKHNIPAPQTIFMGPDTSIESVFARVKYPVIIKPTVSTFWHNPKIKKIMKGDFFAGTAKVLLCHNSDELCEAYRLIAPLDPRMIIQEVIPGEDSRLVYFSFYFDRQSKPLGIFAGRKYRVIPTGFGSASYVRSMYDEELKESAFKLLLSVGYQGLGGVEFKKDPTDGQYKLIEFNSRFGMWDGLGVRCGVDLAYIAYCDAINKPFEPVLSYRQNVAWFDWQRDFRAMLEYHSKKELTFREWKRSLKGEKMWAIYSRDDWRPGIFYSFSLLCIIFERLNNKYLELITNNEKI